MSPRLLDKGLPINSGSAHGVMGFRLPIVLLKITVYPLVALRLCPFISFINETKVYIIFRKGAVSNRGLAIGEIGMASEARNLKDATLPYRTPKVRQELPNQTHEPINRSTARLE